MLTCANSSVPVLILEKVNDLKVCAVRSIYFTLLVLNLEGLESLTANQDLPLSLQ